MWLDNLKELKEESKMSCRQIADAAALPESTVKRIFGGKTDDPCVTTIYRIVKAMGGSLDDILSDTNSLLSREKLTEVKERLDVVSAQLDCALAENNILKAKEVALSAEVDLLKREILHKDELLAVHDFYMKRK